MSMDTATKRVSAAWPLLPFRVAGPVPDGGIDTGDRALTLFSYSGISASAVADIWTDAAVASGTWSDSAVAAGTWTDSAAASGTWSDA